MSACSWQAKCIKLCKQGLQYKGTLCLRFLAGKNAHSNVLSEISQAYLPAKKCEQKVYPSIDCMYNIKVNFS